MRGDAVRLTVVEQVATTGPCVLCATDPASLVATVLVHHARGGSVPLVACDRCTRAVRRLAAVIGSEGQLTAVTDAPLPTPTPAAAEPAVVAPPGRGRSWMTRAAVLLEYRERLLDADGTEYVVRVAGGQRRDGVWVGWLEFVAAGGRQVRRTGEETTQHSWDDLYYWATGLEPVYLQGAFTRAR